MKRKLLSSIIGIAASLAVTSAMAQGKISLNNFSDTGGQPLYGATTPPGDGSGILNPAPSSGNWVIGFYYHLGDVTGSVGSDPSGIADPASLGGGLVFATGVAGDLTTITAGAGYFTDPNGDAIINGWSSGLVTAEIVAYDGSSYNSAAYRGHSIAFTFTPIASTAGQPAGFIVGSVGNTSEGNMPNFSVFAVATPEPSTFALAGLGAAAMLIFRRRK